MQNFCILSKESCWLVLFVLEAVRVIQEDETPSDWPAGESAGHSLEKLLRQKSPAHCRRCHFWAGGPGCIRQ